MNRTIHASLMACATVMAAALSVSAAHAQQAAPPSGAMQFMTGAVPIDDATYATLPALGKYRAFLPRHVDLTANFPTPGYQGVQPSCVAWATTYAARSFLYGQDVGRQPSTPDEKMSPAYIYNRLRRPGSLCDKAIRIIDALDFLKTEGAVTLADFPDDIARCPFPAPDALREKASRFRLSNWRKVERKAVPGSPGLPVDLDDIKGALYRGEPIVFAMPAMDDFKALRGDAVYRRSERANSNYHAMTITGYDEDRQALRIINSWGTWWGDKGYAWIDYQTFRLLVTEAYALQDNQTHRPAPAPPQASRPPREVLQSLADKLPCGAIRLNTSAGRLSVSGFGGDADKLAELRQAALAVDPAADWRVARHPWPQCEAEMTLAGPLARAEVGLIAQTARGNARSGDPVTMTAGEFFGISADVPAGKPYLSLIYLQADGSAVELYRGQAQPAVAGGHSVTIGLSGDAAARFRIAPPFGDESVIALASDRPLFGDELKDYTTERAFLSALRARLTAVPAESVSAAVLRIRTAP